MKHLVAAIGLSAIGAFSTPSIADVMHEPLWVQNLSPLTALIAVPSQRTAHIQQGLSLTLHFDVATHFLTQTVGAEHVSFDGETDRNSLSLGWGFSQNWAATVVLPVIRHSGGVTDSYVNKWHDFFLLSDGGRHLAPNDQLRYQFDAAASHSVVLDASGSGVGDVVFEIAHARPSTSAFQIGYALGYKASTGQVRAWRGSGASDLYGVVRFSGRSRKDAPLYWHGQFGLVHAGDSELLGPNQKDWVWFAGLSAEWMVHTDWSLLAQIDSHSAIVQTAIPALGQPAGILSLGLRHQLTPQWAIDIGFAEDIIVESAPDIIFQASIHYR
ncbi:MAG: DUF3187 family protein, partial [Gammaproteobacteria bacterium]